MDEHTVIIPFAPVTAEWPPPQTVAAARAAPAPPGAEHDPSRTLLVPDYSTKLLGDGPAPAPQKARGLPSNFVLRDRYRVLKTIGRGGFSFVYLCEHIRTGQLSAIKEAFPTHGASRGEDGGLVVTDADAHNVTRDLMLAEVVAIAKSRHRNVVRIEDSFEANGTLYFAMDFVEGEPVSALISRKKGVSLDTASHTAGQLLEALQTMHDADLLHGDIKPKNIIITQSRTPKLIDLGGAARISDPSGAIPIFSPGYSAPERLRGVAELGPWSDVFSFSATMLALLTGVQPPARTDGRPVDSDVPWTMATFPQAADGPAERRMRMALLAGVSHDLRNRPQSIQELSELIGIDRAGSRSGVSADDPSHSVFISYARADQDRVEPLVRGLQMSGINIWIDRKGITPGEAWAAEIVRGVRRSRIFLLASSSNSMNSPNVMREVYVAQEEEKRMLVVRMDDTPFPDEVSLFLSPVQHVDFSEGGVEPVVSVVRDALIRQQE